MPVGHSPPQERQNSSKLAPKTNSSEPRDNAANTCVHIKQLLTRTTTPNVLSPSEPTSWSEQNKTPTSTTYQTNYKVSTTNTPITTLASFYSATTTTSVVFTSAPIMTTKRNTLQTVNTAIPAIQQQQTETTKEITQVKQSNKQNNECESSNKNTAVQTTQKRYRNSPSKQNDYIHSTKKHKSKDTTTNQRKLTSYWLSQQTSSNMFDLLSDDEPDNDTTDNSGTKRPTATENLNPIIKKRKPPPIYIQNVERIDKLMQALSTIPDCKYELKALKNNEVKLQPLESHNYTAIINLLKEKKTQYYTFKLKEERGFKVFLRGMHYSADKDEIKQELLELGHEIINIQNILQKGTKKPLPLFSLEMKQGANNKDIYSINNLLHCKISFEPPHQKKTIPQCTNCQKYGHTKNFCTKTPVCVKCAGNHKTIECVVENSSNIKCAHCGGKHTASYRGCAVYKALKIKHYPEQRNKELNTDKQQNALNRQIDSQYVKPTMSYAQVISNNPQSGVTSSETNSEATSNDDIKELKEMMKQVFAQMSNIMNIITLLVNKIDGQHK